MHRKKRSMKVFGKYSEQLAAVGVWLEASLKEGAWAQTTWTDAYTDKVTEEVKKKVKKKGVDSSIKWRTGPDLGQQWVQTRQVHVSGRWRVRNGSLLALYQSLIAAPARPGIRGVSAERALNNHSTAATRVRVLTFPIPIPDENSSKVRDNIVLAAIVESDKLFLFDPRAGVLYEWGISSDLIDDFLGLLKKSYGFRDDRLDFYTFNIKVTDVFYTWFGDKEKADKDNPSNEQRDLMGPKLLSAHGNFEGFKPRIKFFCLKKYVEQYRADLPAQVEVIAIEDQFAESASGILVAPNYDKLEASMKTLFTRAHEREFFNVRPNRAFFKDTFHLYCAYQYGGYYLDTGVFPKESNETVRFPEPTTFGVVSLIPSSNTQKKSDTENSGVSGPTPAPQSVPHWQGEFGQTGFSCAAIQDGQSVLHGYVLQNVRGLAQLEPSQLKLDPRFDVFVTRSKRGDIRAMNALIFNIYLRFMIDASELKFDSEQYQSACRYAIKSAAATGLTHERNSEGKRCSAFTDVPAESVIAIGQPDEHGRPYIKELGLAKMGFNSTRPKPPE